MEFEKLNRLRREYQGKPIFHEGITSPFQLFQLWFEEAINANCMEPNAMIVSTCQAGQPSSRVVLLKQFDDNGFYFFTNYASRKGREIEENSRVSLLFYWPELYRQVRIEGIANKVPKEMSDAYFQSRPRDAQIQAIVSPQSQEIPSREWLLNEFDAFKHGQHNIFRPKHWGGFVVLPNYFEFFQGMENRLHDRLVFAKQKNGWVKKILAP